MTWMSRRDLAAQKGVNERTVARWVKQGRVERRDRPGQHPVFRFVGRPTSRTSGRPTILEVRQEDVLEVGHQDVLEVGHLSSQSEQEVGRPAFSERPRSRTSGRPTSRTSRPESRTSQWEVWADAAPGREAPPIGPDAGEILLDIAIYVGAVKVLCWAGGVNMSELGRVVVPAFKDIGRALLGRSRGKKRRRLPRPRVRARVTMPERPHAHTYH